MVGSLLHFFFQGYGDPRDLHSFPTRRSSDLDSGVGALPARVVLRRLRRRAVLGQAAVRSEEHTSELQSHVNLVCRLLLEKKKRALSGHFPAPVWRAGVHPSERDISLPSSCPL